jgi:nucleoside-diphosphate-sugar epimerase
MNGESHFRATSQAIRKKRNGGACTVLLTGGTGFIGSHVAMELLRKGCRVLALARPQGRLSGEQRVHRLLGWFGVAAGDCPRLRVIEGHLDSPDFGLDRARYEELAATVDEIVHCASSTSFSERNREEVEKTNITGLENVLALAARSRCAFFHHVSTAYVAGKRSGRCAEELVETGAFTNVYEETKYLGERAVRDRCEREGIRLNIYRPSIVYGDSRSGRTLRFDAVYYPVKAAVFFRNVYARDIREHGGAKAREMGVSIGADERIHLPLRVETIPSGGVNLIPIDYFLASFMAIMDESLAGDVFHIVNRSLVTIETLADYTSRFFGIDGIRAAPPDAFIAAPKNALEKLFDRFVEAYGPYMKDTRIFENGRAEAILAKRRITCPEFGYDIYSNCMRYAIEVEWGAKLFDTPDGVTPT